MGSYEAISKYAYSPCKSGDCFVPPMTRSNTIDIQLMPELISKIQYKNCEKGEFFSEQPRNYEDTLALIQSFPWDEQRGSDIQVTGPGIIIHGPDNDYLKVALYFNSKFSLYYLDKGGYLYEYHTSELIEECQKVKEYFNGRLNLEGFEKHFFNIGYCDHFETHIFEYRASLLKSLLSWALLVIPLSMFVFINFELDNTLMIKLSVFAALIAIFITLGIYLSYNGYYLKLSKAHDEFQFGKRKEGIQTYSKQDVKEVVFYEDHRNSRPIPISSFNEARIFFNNGSFIEIPKILISSIRLKSKFPENLIKIEYQTYWGTFKRQQ